jgi:hypothetical protein
MKHALEYDENDILSPLENFVSIKELIQCGGSRKQRAEFIMNQFSSNNIQKKTSKVANTAHPVDEFNQQSQSVKSKRTRYTQNYKKYRKN